VSVDLINKLKDEAKDLFGRGMFFDACRNYYSIIDIVRYSNDTLKSINAIKELEIVCRSNITLCKIALGEYSEAVE